MGTEAGSLLDGALDGGRGWFMYRHPRLNITYMDNERLTADGYQAYLTHLDADLAALGPDSPRRGVLYHTDGNQPFVDAPRRRAVAEVLARHRDSLARVTAGYAMVSRSTVARGVLTAIFWVEKPPYPTKLTGELDEALQWLAERTDGLEVSEMRECYERVQARARVRYEL